MWDFEPIMEIWKSYAGTGAMLVLFVLALYYIWKKEERREVRSLFVYGTLLVAAVFCCPPFRKIFVHLLDAETYYRILWILPMGVAIAYAGVLLIQGQPDRRFVRPIGVLALTAAIVLSGSLVYRSQYVTKAENAYHIPQIAVDICEEILPEETNPETRVLAVFPSELIHFIRQYSSNIRMPYGREMLVERWDNERELFTLMEAEIYDVEWIADKAIQNYCRYVILNRHKPKTEPMENYGYVLTSTIDPYEIYMDTRF